ncbi:hypothetical protein RRG08_051042 [Elysia crispata]|uniref:Uncharacterized protein n=1 Tax=Elysia crispata TaxID=231223 RepID=A0AAE0Z4T9_9GAST|nr:hypothetical protein RRG08_051042 [Elysia crispata]
MISETRARAWISSLITEAQISDAQTSRVRLSSFQFKPSVHSQLTEALTFAQGSPGISRNPVMHPISGEVWRLGSVPTRW